MDGSADRFLDLMHQLEDFTQPVSPEQAHTQFDETTLQLFWMRWPQLSAWAGSLWRLLSEEVCWAVVSARRVRAVRNRRKWLTRPACVSRSAT